MRCWPREASSPPSEAPVAAFHNAPYPDVGRERSLDALSPRLNGEIFYTLREAQVLIEQWRVHYNTIRPHGALGYRPPAPEIIVPAE